MSFSHAGFRLCTIKCKDALGTHFPLVRNDSGGKGAPRYFATAHPSVPLRDFGMQKQSLCNLRKHDGTVGHIFANRNFSGKQRIYMLLWEAFFFPFVSILHKTFILEPYSITVYSCGYREYYCNECVSQVLGTTSFCCALLL